jgi:AcrR family transcriptional regulator
MSLRADQVELTRRRLLGGAVAVLRRGGELSFSRVAKAARLPERTAYRHFKTAEGLERAVWHFVLARFANDRHPESFAAYSEHVAAAFARFSADAGLVRAILHSRQGLRLRRVDDDARCAALRRIVETTAGAASARERAQLSAVLRVLYSAPAWEILTELTGLSAAEAADAVTFAAQRMLRPTGTTTRRKARS